MNNMIEFCEKLPGAKKGVYPWDLSPEYHEGYLVPLRDSLESYKLKKCDSGAIQEALRNYLRVNGIAYALQAGERYLLSKVNSKVIEFTVCNHEFDLEYALTCSVMRQVPYVFDTKRSKFIKSTWGQAHGTETQKLAFARIQVKKLLSDEKL